MITVQKIDGSYITVNADEIETTETLHDTTIALKSGKRIIVKNSSREIIAAVIEYKRACNAALPQIKTQSDEII